MAGEWELCGDRFYERVELYRPTWGGLDVEDMRIIPARYGGPVALMRDDRKIVRLQPGESTKPTVRIFTAAGGPVAAFEWDGGRVGAAGWTDGEDLVLVPASGAGVRVVDAWAGRRGGETASASPPHRTMTLGPAAERDGLAAADVWGDGVVAVTRGGAVLAVTGLGGGGNDAANADVDAPPPRLDTLATCLTPGASVGAVAALPPASSPTGGPAAIVASGADLILATASSAKVRATAPAPITALALSPCGAFIAAFTADGRLLVWASDFSAALSEFATQADGPPLCLAWCGADAVLLLWSGGLALLVGPYGDWIKYDVPGAAALAPEPDGVRILGGGRHDLARRVADALADAFRPGSTAAVATLVDARRALDAGDPAAHACLRELGREELAAGAAAAAAAAGAAVRPRPQGDLLKAASLGLAFALGGGTENEGTHQDALALTRAAAGDVAHAASLLRVRRCLASPEVGWPLTGGQAALLGHAALVGRLAKRGHHLLALRAADALGVPAMAGAIATHWAAAVLAASDGAPDAAVGGRLRARLAGLAGVRYGDLAAAAAAAGRPGLAADLLDAEPDAGARVPLLLDLGDGGRALDAAVRAADPALISLVVDRVAGRAGADGMVPGPPAGGGGAAPGGTATSSSSSPWSLADRARRSRAVRAALVAAVAAGSGGATPEVGLARFLGASDAAAVGALARLGSAAAASTAAAAARAAGDARACGTASAEAAAAYDRAADLFAKAGAPHWAGAAADGARLRRLQAGLEAATGHAVLGGLPPAATWSALVRVGDAAAASRSRTDLRISDRAVAWGKARAAAAARDWAGLEGLAAVAAAAGRGGGGTGGGGSSFALPPDGLAALARAAGAPDAVVVRLVSRMPASDPAVKAEVLAGLGLGRAAAEVVAAGWAGDGEGGPALARAARGLFGGRGGGG